MGAAPCCVGVLALLLGATVVLAAKPGPNNFRYPDEIVYPKVKCLKEGAFPHPKNCSWFYRCVDRMNIGYYWKYYFECEPGTVFSDDLDQCVHPSQAKPPCGGIVTSTTTAPTTTTAPPVIPCQGVEGTCKTYEVCEPVKRKRYFCDKIRCPLRTPELSCAEGYSFDMDERMCAQPPAASTLCGATTTINITEKGKLSCSAENRRPIADFIKRLYCETYVLCDGSTFRGRKELCKNYYECQTDGDGWTASLRTCPSGLLYSYDFDKCDPAPTKEELC